MATRSRKDVPAGADDRSAAGAPISVGQPARADTPRPKRGGGRLADAADRHVLYQRAVQEVSAEIEFVHKTFRSLRGRRPTRLREDFCGTGNTSCAWVRAGRDRTAVGLDVDAATLDWGRRHNVASLPEAARGRVRLLERNVLDPGPGTGRMDCVLAMNFSWWLLTERAVLVRYFRSVREALVGDGLFFLDTYGGWEATRIQKDRRIVGGKSRGFLYVWDQQDFDPISGMMTAAIHFRLRDGSWVRNAFRYHWRLYTIAEARDALLEAGFADVGVYWEGDDDKGGGNGIFTRQRRGETCPSYIAYIVAQK